MNTPHKKGPVRAEKRCVPKGHFAVAASPFNSVKFELALILVIAVVLWLVLERLYPHRIEAFLLLAGYSLLAAGWIILRVRHILKQASERVEP